MILQKMCKFSNRLIIAGDVIDLPLVQPYLPQTASKEWGHGQVLITTQNSDTIPLNAPHTYNESLSAGMQPDDAVELLKQVSQMPNQENVEKVAEGLEYQPLALAAAAFFVQNVLSDGSSHYSWAEYLCVDNKSILLYLREVLTTTKRIYGEEHTNVVVAYHNLGIVCSDIEQYNEAKAFFEKALINHL